MLSLKTIAPLVLAAASAHGQPRIQALILTGHNNHDWQSTTPFLRQSLEAAGRFDVRVVEQIAGITAKTLEPYSVLILHYVGPRWGETTERAVEAFVRNGGGLVSLHGSSYPFGEREVLGERMSRTGRTEPPWPEFGRMMGAVWTNEPKTGHGQRHVFTVKVTEPAHPIVAGLGGSFTANDELYHRMRFVAPVNVIATAFDAPGKQGTGKDEPILWTLQYGKGRVFQHTLGHDLTAMQLPGFVHTFTRGVEWAATGAVAPAPPRPDKLRLQVTMGGHPYDLGFESLFHYDDFAVNVNPHPSAYRRDLRKSTDVLVLYDSVQEINEKEKKVLQDFLESGKGLVVLHHALVSYNDWPWWSEEVTGGLYLMKPKGDLPRSTFQHDQWMRIEAAAKHPVLAGVPPLELYDETYQGMWFSPSIRPLLKTTHPKSDPTVAWISPYAKSRVIVIQPGHGKEAMENAGYRRLVRNAILWAGGRLGNP